MWQNSTDAGKQTIHNIKDATIKLFYGSVFILNSLHPAMVVFWR